MCLPVDLHYNVARDVIKHVSRQNYTLARLYGLTVCLGDKLEALQLSTCSDARCAIQETRMKCLLCAVMRLILYTWALLCVLFEEALIMPCRPNGRRF
jgi:hypothetical protein